MNVIILRRLLPRASLQVILIQKSHISPDNQINASQNSLAQTIHFSTVRRLQFPPLPFKFSRIVRSDLCGTEYSGIMFLPLDISHMLQVGSCGSHFSILHFLIYAIDLRSSIPISICLRRIGFEKRRLFQFLPCR